MPSKGGFQLTDGDREILTYVYQCRLVTIEHLMALTERSRRALNRRLLGLTKHTYLYRRRDSLYQKYIYTLNRKAGPVLVEDGVASAEVLNLRVRLHELKDLFLKHALMLTDIQTTLILATRESPIVLVAWQEGKALYDSVYAYEDGERKRFPVRPDAFFTLEDTRRPQGKNRMHFFLEADRSTTTNKRFQRKIKGYAAWFTQGLHTQKYGITSARVLTLTLSEARAENLCEAAGEVLEGSEQRFYYFASMDHFSLEEPGRVLEPIFVSPQTLGTDKRYELMPPLRGQG